MAKNDNLKDFLVDVADAIREKKGTTELINPQDFANEIASIESGGGNGWTGHADVEGLKAIGWTDDDIAYYQQYGVNWNEEDDEWHKVTDDNKALYGVLTASNISEYKDRIVYLPKIDTSNVTSMSRMFEECRSLKYIPQLDTSKVTSMNYMFGYCYSLKYIPQLDTSNVKGMYQMFYGCYSLTTIPQLDTSKVTTMGSMFFSCRSLMAIPIFDTSNVTNMNYMFSDCYSLTTIPLLDTSNVTDMSSIFSGCYSLTHVNLKNVKSACNLKALLLLTKASLLYLINNEATTSAITIQLASYAYTRWANDPDIVEALANHPNISLASA